MGKHGGYGIRPLTDRAKEAQRLRESGCTLREIAESLGVSVSTVHADLTKVKAVELIRLHK